MKTHEASRRSLAGLDDCEAKVTDAGSHANTSGWLGTTALWRAFLLVSRHVRECCAGPKLTNGEMKKGHDSPSHNIHGSRRKLREAPVHRGHVEVHPVVVEDADVLSTIPITRPNMTYVPMCAAQGVGTLRTPRPQPACSRKVVCTVTHVVPVRPPILTVAEFEISGVWEDVGGSCGGRDWVWASNFQ